MTFIIATNYQDSADSPYIRAVEADNIEDAVIKFFASRSSFDEIFQNPELLADCLNEIRDGYLEYFIPINLMGLTIKPLTPSCFI